MARKVAGMAAESLSTYEGVTNEVDLFFFLLLWLQVIGGLELPLTADGRRVQSVWQESTWDWDSGFP